MRLSPLIGLAFIVVAICGFALLGCAATHPQTTVTTTHTFFTAPGTTPKDLHAVAVGLNWLTFLAIAPMAIGLTLFLFSPACHTWSLIVFEVSGAVELLALLLRVTLWCVPWIAIAGIAVGVGFLIYEIYRYRAQIKAKLTAVASKA